MTTHYTSKYLALCGICLLAFTAFLDFTIVNTALPFIQQAFQVELLSLQWISNIFPIILTMSMIAVGKIGDLIGRKRFFYFGVFLFGTAALFAGFSPTIDCLIFFRGVQALGASITFIVSSSLLSEIYSEKERSWAIGIYGGVTGTGLMLGPFFGGILIGAFDWRWVFWINIPLILAGLYCCFVSLKGASRREIHVHLDWKGFCLLIFGLGLLMYGIISGAGTSFSLTTMICIAISLLCLGTLFAIELKSAHPLLHFEIFKDPLLLLSVISCAIAGVVSYVFMFFNPLFLENVLHLTPYSIGFLIAIIPAAQVVISFGFRYFLKIGLANLLFLSCLAPLFAAFLHLFFEVHSTYPVFILPFALLGINWGLSNTAMISAVNATVSPNKIGESIGTIATIWNFAGSILLALSTVIFQTQNDSFLNAYKTVIEFNIAFMIVVILFAFVIRRKASTKKA